MVTLKGGMLSLREALDHLSAVTKVRLSYSSEALPLDRRVCATFKSVAMGHVLTDLLDGAGVRATIVSPNQVVLVPLAVPAASRERRTAELPLGVLDRIVVTGSAAGAEQRSLAVDVDVANGERLTDRGEGSLAHVMNGDVPGIWAWESAPSAMAARYGSIRGTSSFGVNAPKIYIDGIEAANPLLVTQLVPETIERIEVIRGPQGSALYGADAISGVVNIVTRHDGVSGGASRLQLRSAFGVAGSAYVPSGVLARDIAASMRGGSNIRGGGLSLSYRSVGEFLPQAHAGDLLANADFRRVGSRSTLVATGRFFSRDAGTALPLLPGLSASMHPTGDDADSQSHGGVSPWSPGGTHFDSDSGVAQSVREYTFGLTGRLAQNERWTHTLVAGMDGYALAGEVQNASPIVSASDSALRDARGEAARITLRASSVGLFNWGPNVTNTLTFAAEQTVTRQETAAQELVYIPRTTPGRDSVYRVRSTEWRRTSGVVGQLNTSLGRAVYFTAGLRFEGSSGPFGPSRIDALPMLGVSAVRDLGPLSIKLRTAYGKGIRVPQLSVRERALFVLGRLALPFELPPETQSGVEAGVDAYLGRTLSAHVTRFDQLAAGLVQMIAMPQPTAGTNTPSSRVAYELQHVGRIANRGWEVSLQANRGRLSLGGALTLVDSRVLQLASGYAGDLRAGDRPLEVPSRTMSLSAGWSSAGWSASFGATRAADWVNYDRIALAHAFASTDPEHRPTGATLRDYWQTYDGVTRLRASFSRDLFRSLSFVAYGENLLNTQRGEPDNITIVPGRTITAGLRIRL
jgi:iron complex outermembrane receptor protein